MAETFCVIGAGNGGKACAADLALQGKQVRLFEFADFAANLAGLETTRRLRASGAVQGEALLALATTDLAEAVDGADVIMICTQALAHDRVARSLAPLVAPSQVVVLNPGSTGGALHLAQIMGSMGVDKLPILVEFSTLTYGCRAEGTEVSIGVKANRVMYGTLPAAAIAEVGPDLEALYPGLVRGTSVLEAGLNNANPVIHPPIVLLNAARFENEGSAVRFYREGMSPSVARLIEQLDGERMALLRALGYPAQPDPVTSVEQGYASSTDYYECYAKGPVFVEFAGPASLDHRYFHEDMGMGLVLFCELGQLLDVATPASRAVAHMGALISGIDYFAQGLRSLEVLGLAGLTAHELRSYLETGERKAP